MKAIMIFGSLMIMITILSGCDAMHSTQTAYFTIDEECCGECLSREKLKAKCDDTCDHSGIRISKKNGNNQIQYYDRYVICKCQ